MKKSIIVTVANQKGGVGKSTLTTLLALSLQSKYKVGIIDTDPQLSLYNNLKDTKFDQSIFKQDLISFVKNINSYNDYEILLVDTLPTTDTTIVKLFTISDIVLVPTGASILDITATMNTIELLSNLNVTHKVIFNNIKNLNDLKEIKDYFIKERIAMSDTYIFSRVAYSRIFKNDLNITDDKATEELSNLISEIV